MTVHSPFALSQAASLIKDGRFHHRPAVLTAVHSLQRAASYVSEFSKNYRPRPPADTPAEPDGGAPAVPNDEAVDGKKTGLSVSFCCTPAALPPRLERLRQIRQKKVRMSLNIPHSLHCRFFHCYRLTAFSFAFAFCFTLCFSFRWSYVVCVMIGWMSLFDSKCTLLTWLLPLLTLSLLSLLLSRLYTMFSLCLCFKHGSLSLTLSLFFRFSCLRQALGCFSHLYKQLCLCLAVGCLFSCLLCWRSWFFN